MADAAVAVADAEGTDAVTVARVAADLGVRAPSLYNHVASRDELLTLVARRGYAELADALRAEAVGVSGPAAVTALAHAYRAYARTAPGRYAAMQRARPGEEGGAEVLAVLVGALRAWDLHGDGELHTARALRSALHGFVALELGGGFGLDLDLDASYGRLLGVLLDGLGRPEPQG